VSLTPARYADTRDGAETFDGRSSGGGPAPGGSVLEIPIAGRGGVPADATAAVMNLTAVLGTGPGFAIAYPCGAIPNASIVNYGLGTVDPNEIVVKLSSSGSACVYVLTGVHILVDVVGYVPATSPYVALTPARYADSRDKATFDGEYRDSGPRRGGTMWEIQVAGRGVVPATATTAVVNLTVTGGQAPGFAIVYPCGERPNASSLNYGPGITRPNELIAKLSPSGTLCVFTLTEVDVIVDVVGHT